MGWTDDPTGNFVNTIYQRKCTIAKVTGGTGRASTWRLTIEGVEAKDLENGGVSKDVKSLKDLAWEHLKTTVGAAKAKENSARFSQNESRFRAIEVATGIVTSLPASIATVGPHDPRASFDEYFRAILFTASLVLKHSQPPQGQQPPTPPAAQNSAT